jgi:hypothetical protein
MTVFPTRRKIMRTYKLIALSIAGLAAAAATVTPASARPHRHQVCHIEHQHHHAARVCHWVG